MREVRHVVDVVTMKGKPVEIVRNFFIYEKEGNVMAKAHKYYSKSQKKLAKSMHKLKL